MTAPDWRAQAEAALALADTGHAYRAEWTPPRIASSFEEALEVPKPAVHGLAYPGAFHLISGKPEALKSWVALWLGLEVVRQGGELLVLDLDGTGRVPTLRRLIQMGLEEAELERVGFLDHMGEFASDTDRTVAKWCERAGPVAVVLDAINPATAELGWKLDEEGMVNLEARVIRPLKAAGAYVLATDHVPKSREVDEDYSIGSQRKHAAADVHLRLELVGEAFRPGVTTMVRLYGKKDRPAGIVRHGERKTAGTIRFESRLEVGPIGELVDVAFNPNDDGRPTGLMDSILEWADRQKLNNAEPWTGQECEEANEGKGTRIREALKELVSDGKLRKERKGFYVR